MSGRGLDDLGEDATGFGRAELRTIRDSLLRPRDVLEAYMTGGADGGGLYARPLRLYLALCGLMMVILFLRGGVEAWMTDIPPAQLEPFVSRSGKSADAFAADADSWISLTLVPVLSASYALGIAPLLRWWDKTDLGWRKGFRAAFAYLNAMTIPVIPFSWFAYDGATAGWTALLILVVFVVTFVRMGRGRWFASLPAGVAKSLLVVVAVNVTATIGVLLLIPIGLAGATFGP